MEQNSPDFQAHVFICTKCSYQLPSGECSSPELAIAFRKSVKDQAKERWDKKKVRVNASGCLGQCERGISCVIYPQNQWILDLREGDEERVIKPLEDLMGKT